MYSATEDQQPVNVTPIVTQNSRNTNAAAATKTTNKEVGTQVKQPSNT